MLQSMDNSAAFLRRPLFRLLNVIYGKAVSENAENGRRLKERLRKADTYIHPLIDKDFILVICKGKREINGEKERWREKQKIRIGYISQPIILDCLDYYFFSTHLSVLIPILRYA